VAFTLPASPPLFQSGQFVCKLARTDHILTTYAVEQGRL